VGTEHPLALGTNQRWRSCPLQSHGLLVRHLRGTNLSKATHLAKRKHVPAQLAWTRACDRRRCFRLCPGRFDDPEPEISQCFSTVRRCRPPETATGPNEPSRIMELPGPKGEQPFRAMVLNCGNFVKVHVPASKNAALNTPTRVVRKGAHFLRWRRTPPRKLPAAFAKAIPERDAMDTSRIGCLQGN